MAEAPAWQPQRSTASRLYDTNSKQLIWRGEAHNQMSDKPEKDTKKLKLEKAVDKMFEKFPPRSA